MYFEERANRTSWWTQYRRYVKKEDKKMSRLLKCSFGLSSASLNYPHRFFYDCRICFHIFTISYGCFIKNFPVLHSIKRLIISVGKQFPWRSYTRVIKKKLVSIYKNPERHKHYVLWQVIEEKNGVDFVGNFSFHEHESLSISRNYLILLGWINTYHDSS